MDEERLLGFDVREMWLDPDDLWDAARRQRYLLRLDVRKPLSGDTLVWPSAFDSGQGIGLPAEQRERLQLAGIPLPGYTGPNAGLWENAADMLRFLTDNQTTHRTCAVIGVSWWPDKDFAEGGPFGPYPANTVPAARDPMWTLLGYDVGDGSLLSGLANCGYEPAEAEALRARWAPYLNENHLFTDPARADEFRAISNQRVSAHAPFFVYGLYLIERTG